MEEAKEEKKTYRTHSKAGDVVGMPKKYAIITLQEYQYATSLCNGGKAYLNPVDVEDGWHVRGDIMYYNGLPASVTQLRNGRAALPHDLDLPLLRVCYNIILHEYTKTGKVQTAYTVYLPDLFAYLGKATVSRNETISIISNMLGFCAIVGVLDGNILPVLLYMGENRDKNTITFASPFINRVIQQIEIAKVRTDKKGMPVVGKDGIPKTKPAYSYLVKPTIRNERNKKAAEIVHIVTALIEQAGGRGEPHILASTIVERHPMLKQALQGANAADRNKILKRTFAKAWELLRTQTYLEEVYREIELPDPSDPANIPTMSRLGSTLFTFRSKGKRSGVDKTGQGG